MSELKEAFESFGEVILSEKTVSHGNQEYIISVRFSSEDKAQTFLDDFKMN